MALKRQSLQYLFQDPSIVIKKNLPLLPIFQSLTCQLGVYIVSTLEELSFIMSKYGLSIFMAFKQVYFSEVCVSSWSEES